MLIDLVLNHSFHGEDFLIRILFSDLIGEILKFVHYVIGKTTIHISYFKGTCINYFMQF